MQLNEFVKVFAEQFDETAIELFTAETVFKELTEWSSLTALSIISMVDEELEKQITGSDLRSVATIEELFNLALNK